MAENPFDQYDVPPPVIEPTETPQSSFGAKLLSPFTNLDEKAESTAMGFGRGVGNVALTAQDWIGQGLSAIGAGDIGGDWLQRNAQMGQARLTKESAPYQQRNPIAFGAGKIGGEVVGVAPVLKAGGAALNAARLPTFGKAFQSGGMDASNAFMRFLGGAGAGATTSLLTDPENVALGTVVGGLVPSAVVPAATKVATKIAEKAVPATDVLRQEAKNLYQAMDASGIRIVQPVVQQLSAGMDNFVKNTQQYLAKGHTAVNSALDELRNFTSEPLSITRLNEFYKGLRKDANRIGGGEGSVLNDMADTISEFMDRLSPLQLGGAAPRDVANLRAANDLQRRVFKSEVIDDILQKATIKSEGEASAVTTATAIQRGFQSLASNKTKMKSFTPEERALIEKVARGTYKTKILNMVSGLRPGARVDLKTLLYAIGGSANLPATMAIAAGTGGANMWRNALVKGQAGNVGRFIRNKGPVTPPNVRPPFALTPAGVSASQQAFPPKKKNAMVR